MAEQRERMANGQPKRAGLMGWISERAEAAQKQRQENQKGRADPSRGQANRNPSKGKPQSKGQRPTGQPGAKKPPVANPKAQGSRDGSGAAPKKPRSPQTGKGAPPGNQLKRDPKRTPDPEETP